MLGIPSPKLGSRNPWSFRSWIQWTPRSREWCIHGKSLKFHWVSPLFANPYSCTLTSCRDGQILLKSHTLQVHYPLWKNFVGSKEGFLNAPLCGKTSNKKLLSHISLKREWNLFRSVLASTLKFPTPKVRCWHWMGLIQISWIQRNDKWWW